MEIPVDLFVSRKHPGLTRGEIGFANSSGDLLFRVNTRSPNSDNLILRDFSGIPLISIYQNKKGSWQCYKEDGGGENKELLFRVERKMHKLKRTEVDVFLAGENQDVSRPDFTVKGLPFQKSCAICKGTTIIAQTSFMYKLNQIFVPRDKFRVTIFPGFDDHAVVAALIVVFFYGKNIYIVWGCNIDSVDKWFTYKHLQEDSHN